MNILDANLVFAYNPGIRASTDYIILHHAAANGDVNSVHRYHRITKGWAGIAYHFYVTEDGAVYRGRQEDWNGGHTSGYHNNSIGICFEGNFEQDTMGEKQLQAGRELIAYLRGEYPTAEVTTHGALNATACPGKNFPLAELLTPAEEASEWSKEAVQKWIDLGLLQGDGNGNYGLKEPVTLERMIVLVERRMVVK